MFLWDTATIRMLMFWFNTHTYLGSTNWTQEVVVVISIIRRRGKRHEGEEDVLGRAEGVRGGYDQDTLYRCMEL